MIRWTLLAVSCLVALPVAQARGDEPSPVIVLVGSGSAFENRVSAELESIGFRVVSRTDANGDPPEGTAAIARIIDGADRRIEVTPSLASAGAGNGPIVIDAGSADDVSSVQVSERIRAYFQPLRERSVSTRTEPVAPPPPPSPLPVAPRPAEPPHPSPSPPARTWSLGVAGGLSVPFDVGGAGLGAMAAFYALPIHWLRVSPFVAAPLVASRLDGKGGSASLYAGMAGATLDFGFVETKSFDLFGGAGYAGVWLRAVGHPNTGFMGSTDDTLMSTLFADLVGRIRLNDNLRLAPEARIGCALPPAVLHFATDSSMHWGLPWGSLALSLEADLVR
jgi:hypothetical protein